jgi:predicted transcriptional regulator
MVSVSGILSAISNDKSLVLFNTIALAGGDTSILISRLNLTRKQYYSRMSDLTNAGVIRRKNGNYFLTSLGKVVYDAQELIGKAVRNSRQSTLLQHPNFQLQNLLRSLRV